jgi:hypothetical protein
MFTAPPYTLSASRITSPAWIPACSASPAAPAAS